MSVCVPAPYCRVITLIQNYSPQGPDIDPSEILGSGFSRNESSAVRDVNSTEDLNKAWFTTAKDKEALIDKGIAWKQGAWSQEVCIFKNIECVRIEG